MEELAVTLEIPAGCADAAIVHVSGEVSISNYRDLLVPLESSSNDAIKWWVLDMSGCGFLSSAGLSAILRGVNRAKQRGGALVLAEMSPRLQSMMKVAGLADVIPHFDTVEEALKSFGEGQSP